MASGPKGSAKGRLAAPRMSSDYGIRAALALDMAVRGPHRDKTIARELNVSVRMAKYLRAGKLWTIDRLNQASAKFRDFDAFLASPEQAHAYIDSVEQQLADLRLILRGEDDDQ